MSARFSAEAAAVLALAAVLICGGSSSRAEQAAAEKARDATSPETAIRQALAKPVELKFVETPLAEVANSLEKKLGVQVRLDFKALDDVGIKGDEPVTFQVSGISARSALELLLRPLDLASVIQYEMLLITTPEEADRQLITEVYDVADLVVHGDASAAPDFDSLAELITCSIEPASWEGSGPPPIPAVEVAGVKAIVFSQTQEVHEQVARLLADLRKARPGKPGKEQTAEARAKAEQVSASQVAGPQSREEAIRRALAKPVKLEFNKTPLLNVVAVLKRKAGIQIVIDTKALDDVGIGSDAPVTVQVADIKLRSALDFMLRPLELTWTIAHEVLLITTPEEADTMLFTKVYDVSDLPSYRNEQGEAVPDFDSLIDTITACIKVHTWDTVGGPGSIAPFDATGIKVLVVSQTWKIHEEVEALLDNLRKVRRRPLTEEEIAKLPPVPVPFAGGYGGGFLGPPAPSPRPPQQRSEAGPGGAQQKKGSF
jgi:hypothetical protein